MTAPTGVTPNKRNNNVPAAARRELPVAARPARARRSPPPSRTRWAGATALALPTGQCATWITEVQRGGSRLRPGHTRPLPRAKGKSVLRKNFMA